MAFNKVELELIYHIARGENKVDRIRIGKSISQVYRQLDKLKKKDLISIKRGKIALKPSLYLNLLIQNLLDNPNLINIISDSGLNILLNLEEPKKIKDIIEITGLKKSIVYNKIRQCMNASILLKRDNRYRLNEKIWEQLVDFLLEYKKYDENIDERVPVDSRIYYKDDKGVLFCSKQERDAQLTAFSIYSEYGIKIYTTKNYYYLPKGKLNKKKILLHSLIVAEKEFDHRKLMYITLFYLKHKTTVEHEILKNIKKILKGESIKGYPKLDEIKEKAAQYNIKW
jgi:hypothetical protein